MKKELKIIGKDIFELIKLITLYIAICFPLLLLIVFLEIYKPKFNLDIFFSSIWGQLSVIVCSAFFTIVFISLIKKYLKSVKERGLE